MIALRALDPPVDRPVAGRLQVGEHRCCMGPDTNVNLHVYPPGCPEIEAAP